MSTKMYEQIIGRYPEDSKPKQTKMSIRTQRTDKGWVTQQQPCKWLELKTGDYMLVIEEYDTGKLMAQICDFSDMENPFCKSVPLLDLFEFIKKNL